MCQEYDLTSGGIFHFIETLKAVDYERQKGNLAILMIEFHISKGKKGIQSLLTLFEFIFLASVGPSLQPTTAGRFERSFRSNTAQIQRIMPAFMINTLHSTIVQHDDAIIHHQHVNHAMQYDNNHVIDFLQPCSNYCAIHQQIFGLKNNNNGGTKL